jgi:nitroreductase
MTVIDHLLSRRSAKINQLSGPGPSAEEIQKILTAATRVPDHGKLAPWWFVLFQGDTRKEFGEKVLREAFKAEDPEAAPAKLDLEAERFANTPLVIAVISRVKESKIPQWEQVLSAGAACINICHAANAMGYGTNWVTQWYSFNPIVHAALNLDENDRIAGFIYVGTPAAANEERERPALTDVVNEWSANFKPNKGDHYGKAGTGIPAPDFAMVKKQA